VRFAFPLIFLAGAIIIHAPAGADFAVPRPPGKIGPNMSQAWLNGLAPGSGGGSSGVVLGKLPERAVPHRPIARKFLPQVVAYKGREAAGTIVIDTNKRFLLLVLGGGKAKRYGVGVGRPGFEWAGTHTVTAKAEWPTWTPPEEMRMRQPLLPVSMKGGPNNPLGARALYLGDTLYRIHGSNEPWSIGRAVSSGCIRMRNEDVIDLYARVPVGTKVVVI
jgi:lipoprotein-anchoring transpeptidase ErfK/SrfK